MRADILSSFKPHSQNRNHFLYSHRSVYLPHIAVLVAYWHNLLFKSLQLKPERYTQAIISPFLFFARNLSLDIGGGLFYFRKNSRYLHGSLPIPYRPPGYFIQAKKKEAAATNLVQLPVLIFILIFCINTLC